MTTELLVQELETIVPGLVSMFCVCNVADIQTALDLAKTLVSAAESELSARNVTPQEEKAIIDASTQAAIDAKFPGKP
ncbi:MAG TPA: hypothetical protein VGJ79_08885 [Candidatus Dormibacteraeota bacterium]|jgi:hypothetical protein